jgi:beta-lactamase class D
MLLLVLSACASTPTRSETAPPSSETEAAAVPSLTTAETTQTQPNAPPIVQRDDLLPELRAGGYDGSFVAHTLGTDSMVCVGSGCTRRVPPASTFKIPHAAIALEVGALSGPEHPMAWDGEERWVASWNQDHVLRTAIRDSVLWYFMRVAPLVGQARMQHALDTMGYGNATIGALDRFWIDGSLLISPVEQVAFWSALADGSLPGISAETRETVLSMCALARDETAVLYGKTGWDHRPDSPDHGWFTGCIDAAGTSTCFALVLETEEASPELDRFVPARRAAAERLLRHLDIPVPEH